MTAVTTATIFPASVASTTGSTWTTTSNATGSGTGTTSAAWAVFTNATGGAVGTIQLSGYAAQNALGSIAPTSVDSVAVACRQNVGTVARWSTVTVQLYTGATPIGSAQSLTLSTSTSNSQTITFSGANCPTYAQLSDLQVQFAATKSGGTSSTFNVDTAGATITYTPAAITALTETFATLDTAKWTVTAGAAATGGQLVLTPSTAYPDAISIASTNLVGSAVYAEFVSATATGTTGTLESWFMVRPGAAASYNNTLTFQKKGTDFTALRDVATVRTTVATTTYSALNHRWLRFRESGGTVFWETSIDGATWNAFGSWVYSLDLTVVQVSFGSGYGGVEGAPGTAVYDNLNIPPVSPAPDTRRLALRPLLVR